MGYNKQRVVVYKVDTQELINIGIYTFSTEALKLVETLNNILTN